MHRARCAPWFFSLAIGCASGKTEIMIRVDSDIATVREGGALQRVGLQLSRVGDSPNPEEIIDLSGAARVLPGDYLVRFATDDARALRVRVTGYLTDGNLVRREHEVTALLGERSLLRVFLADRCRPARCNGVQSGCTPAPECPAGSTCGLRACEPVRGVELAPYAPLSSEDAAVRMISECVRGSTRACYTGSASTRARGICRDGVQRCEANGRWGACEGDVLPERHGDGAMADTCDGRDEDCNGAVDDNCCVPNATDGAACYEGPANTMGRGICRAGVRVCNETGTGWSACSGQLTPRAEICNGFDDNCDGQVDESPRSRECVVGERRLQIAACIDGRETRCPFESCVGRSCGADVDGRSCGSCATGELCTPDGRCATPICAGRHCGTDRNGLTCGYCPPGETCTAVGRCVTEGCGEGNLSVRCSLRSTPDWFCPRGALCGTQYAECPCSGETRRTHCDGQDAPGSSVPILTACTHGGTFCGRGTVRCSGGVFCPRNSMCIFVGTQQRCQCLPGFRVEQCSGVPCVGECAGVDYTCSPLRM